MTRYDAFLASPHGTHLYSALLFLSLLIFGPVFLAPSAFAATLSGSVYDLSLDPLTDALVTINTTPRQQYVAQDAYYSFTVPPGTYTVTAQELKNGEMVAFVSEVVVVTAEGSYHLDLLVFPLFVDEDELPDSVSALDVLDENKDSVSSFSSAHYNLQDPFIAGFFVLACVFVMYVLSRRSKRKQALPSGISSSYSSSVAPFDFSSSLSQDSSLPSDLSAPHLDETAQHILTLLDEHGGRISQKDIRKVIPLSEAKISLVITDLESRGLLRKIKKGRANILVRL